MAEKKKGKQRKTEEDKPTKEEYAVAKYLRFNLPARDGKLHGMEVKCFFGNTAVDKLLESKWSAAKNKKDPLFTNRHSCVIYLLRLLEMGLFHRAEREHRKRDKEKDKSKRKKRDKDGEKEEPVEEEQLRERKVRKDKKGKRDKEEAPADDETEKKIEKKDDKKKKEKRLKLVMPEQQYFEDKDEIYVWIYDPVNAKTFLIGLLMVLGAIALCMFPLWPEEVRVGVYYLSIALAGFVGFILSLVVVRLILFCLIWVLTLGKHHFWLLPNLTEDVGFFDSFRPLYKHDVVNRSHETKSGDGGKKKKQIGKEEEEKQETVEKKEKCSDKDDSDEFELIKKEDLDQNGAKEENDFDKNEEDDEADVNNEDIENDYDDNGIQEDEIDEDEDNNDEELGDEIIDEEEEEEEKNNSEQQSNKAKKTK